MSSKNILIRIKLLEDKLTEILACQQEIHHLLMYHPIIGTEFIKAKDHFKNLQILDNI